MATIEMECPKCGAPGKVPRSKIQTRLVCRKCLAIFHLNPLGRAVLGEPPTNEPARNDAKAPVRAATVGGESGSSMTRIPILVAALVLLVLLGAVGYGFFNWGDDPAADVTTRATIAAQSIADENAEKFKAAALSGTESEATRFFEKARSSLNMVRRRSPTRTILPSVQLQEVSEGQGTAKVLAVFLPDLGTTRQQQITGVDTVTEKDASAMLATLCFVKDGQGRWRLDGKSCTELTTTR
jgi:hypothetical protein